MVRKFLLTIMMLCFLSASLFAGVYQSPISMYKDNYFVAGNSEDQTKFQISIACNLLYPFNTGFNFAYTQTTWWKVYNQADTMSANYNPEVFYRLTSKDNLFNNVDLGAIDYIQAGPFSHCSTGVEGADHRSINTYYGQIQISSGGWFCIGDNLKVFGYYTKSKFNKDIQKYKGYFENDVFLRIGSDSTAGLTRAELHYKFGGTLSHLWMCAELRVRILSADIQPKFFIQYYRGYGENMVNYNIKDQSVRAGLIF